MAEAKWDVVGIGNAIVDVLAKADDAFLAGQGMAKNAMILIDADRAESLYKAIGPAVEQSGGSAANTIAGLASLGARAPMSARSPMTSSATSSPMTSNPPGSTSPRRA